MINNRQQNGRRRGRGGQRTQGGNPGRPDNGNRIDSRARGNAAQLLEKYKNLARDAQMQGDRVNTEYYLQFADHYFRVLSESRARFEEQNPQARRPQQDGFDEGDENGFENGLGSADDYGDEGEPVRADQYQPQRDGRGDGQREDRQERQSRPERAERFDRQDNRDGRERQPRRDRGADGNRPERAPREQANGNGYAAAAALPPAALMAVEGEPVADGEAPRKRGRPRRVPVEEAGATGFDPTVLPPALGMPVGAEPAGEDEDKPRRRRGRPPASESAQVG